MSHVKRILVWTVLLIGSAVLFYLWANRQIVMIESEVQYVQVEPMLKKPDMEVLEFYKVATSTAMQILIQRDLDKSIWSSSTLKIGSTTDSSSYSFAFPKSGNTLYHNCTYKVELDFDKEKTQNFLGVLLVDAGTGEEVYSEDSGLVYSVTFKDGTFLWSVGNVWPGEYYLSIPMIDGHEASVRSEKFIISQNDSEVCEN